MQEKVFYDKGSVKVTNTRFLVEKDTYVLSNVTSVKSREEPARRGFFYFLAIIGCSFLIAGFLGSAGAIFSGLFIIGFATICIKSLKSYYIVALATASGEVEALKSSDKTILSR